MYVVKAIQDKALQKGICESLNVEYNEYALAYMAADLKEDGETIDEYIGICQFILQGDAEIITFNSFPDRYDDEAVIVLLRAVMSFMHRCGAKMCYFEEGAAPEALIQRSGFISDRGKYLKDLEKFYSSKCCH